MPKRFIDYKKTIDRFIIQYLQKKHETFVTVNSWGPDVIKRLQTFVRSGKTIRGSLVLFSHEMFKGQHAQEAIKAASAIELIHSGLLIHDDIMDQDGLRRGADAMHIQYRNIFPRPRRNVVAGEAMATCVGDLTFFLAMELLSSTPDIQNIVAGEIAAVCLAQMQDVSFSLSEHQPTEKEVLSMYRYKTARYTFSLPLMTGAVLAHANESLLSHVEQLGEHMGLLYQIQDDRLNSSGSSAVTGKPVGSDKRENKKTYEAVSAHVSSTVETEHHDCEKRITSLPVAQSYVQDLLWLLNFIKTRNS